MIALARPRHLDNASAVGADQKTKGIGFGLGGASAACARVSAIALGEQTAAHGRARLGRAFTSVQI
jgi:hypothetical protein